MEFPDLPELPDFEYDHNNYNMPYYFENEVYLDDNQTWKPTASFTTKSRILYSILRDDVEDLKLLLNYPNLFQIVDKFGYPILQVPILTNSIAVFDLLLSQDNCPLEARNITGETALQIALTGFDNWKWMGEHFALSLLKRGAKVDYFCHPGRNSLLHLASERNFREVALFLIESGADLNCQNNYGVTPIHRVLDADECRNQNEMLAMLLYFGADPFIPDFEGFTLIDRALRDENLVMSMKEVLLFYVFDDYSAGYDIPIDAFFGLLETASPLFLQVFKHVTSIDMNKARVRVNLKFLYRRLFMIKSECLKLLLEKFDYVIEEILDACLEEDFIDYAPPQPVFFQNFELLIQSRFNSDVIQIINKTEICKFIEESQEYDTPQKELFESIMLLLSYGANICDEDLNMIYKIFGDCEHFRILLHMDIQITDRNRDCDTIMPSLLYNIHFDIETFLDHMTCFCPEVVMQLLNYLGQPKLKDYCLALQNEEVDVKIKNLPSVRSLLELARNEARKFLIQRFKITNSMQFYTLIKHLPINRVYKKIITFEKKLY